MYKSACWAFVFIMLNAPASAQTITGLVHIEGYGDMPLESRRWAGTKGEERRLEAFQLSVLPSGTGVSLRYMCHLQDVGDVWKASSAAQEMRTEGWRDLQSCLRDGTLPNTALNTNVMWRAKGTAE
jgi:hypothetical protein